MSADSRSVPSTSATTVSPARLGVAAAAAMAVNLTAYGAGSLADASWVVEGSHGTISAGAAVFASLVPLLLAGVVTWLIGRTRPGFVRFAAWAGLAVGVLTAPMAPLAATDVTTGLCLASMHAVTGVAWFLALLPHVRTRRA